MTDIETKSVNAIRILSAEAIQRANSGHPGLPMGAAAIGYELFAHQLRHNPANPAWADRDRFVLSAGHGSMLLYSLQYLMNYGLTKEDLMNFRQLGSKTPGHPEYGVTPGVETSTGPLGQGVANAVGMAQAETILAAKFNRPGFPVVDHYTYCFVGDGCLQEGIAMEAATLAGTWKLGKLIVLYDKNDITIEGSIDKVFGDDVAKRFEAQGWHVAPVVRNGNDPAEIAASIEAAKREKDKPSIVIVKTTIGYGSDKAGTADCHGAPLGAESLAKAKQTLGWDAEPFEVPADVKAHYDAAAQACARYESEWNAMFAAYEKEYPALAAEFRAWMKNEIPDLTQAAGIWDHADKADATRSTGGIVLNKIADLIPNLVGGSADLTPSNKSDMKGKGDYSPADRSGRNIHFGIREHAMSAICNGLQAHGGLNAYCATFFVFSDYMKNAMRMSALMKLPVAYILTHDSIGVGEDGPTHEPVEHIAGLRAMPDMKVWRPCDYNETAAAYIDTFNGRLPSCLVLSRQNLPQLCADGKLALKGGYILVDSEKAVPDAILIATGSEVELAVKAQSALKAEGIDARVVSMPCMEVFEAQTEQYRESVLPKSVRKRVAVEAAVSQDWYRYVGLDGDTVCIDTFGASAPAKTLFEHFGFTVENVVAKVKAL